MAYGPIVHRTEYITRKTKCMLHDTQQIAHRTPGSIYIAILIPAMSNNQKMDSYSHSCNRQEAIYTYL